MLSDEPLAKLGGFHVADDVDGRGKAFEMLVLSVLIAAIIWRSEASMVPKPGKVLLLSKTAPQLI